MSGWYEILGILYFHYFLFFQQVLSTRKMKSLLSDLSVLNFWEQLSIVLSVKDIQTDRENADIFPQLAVS